MQQQTTPSGLVESEDVSVGDESVESVVDPLVFSAGNGGGGGGTGGGLISGAPAGGVTPLQPPSKLCFALVRVMRELSMSRSNACALVREGVPVMMVQLLDSVIDFREPIVFFALEVVW